MNQISLSLILCLLVLTASASADPAIVKQVEPSVVSVKTEKVLRQVKSWKIQLRELLTGHCIDCHEGKDAEGSFDLTELGDDLNDRETARRWILVHDRMVKGEMPPQSAPPIAPGKKSVAIKALSSALTKAGRARSNVMLRRLNRTEYEATIRDLFGIQARVKNILPQDTATDGFDNVGEGVLINPS